MILRNNIMPEIVGTARRVDILSDAGTVHCEYRGKKDNNKGGEFSLEA